MNANDGLFGISKWELVRIEFHQLTMGCVGHFLCDLGGQRSVAR